MLTEVKKQLHFLSFFLAKQSSRKETSSLTDAIARDPSGTFQRNLKVFPYQLSVISSFESLNGFIFALHILTIYEFSVVTKLLVIYYLIRETLQIKIKEMKTFDATTN